MIGIWIDYFLRYFWRISHRQRERSTNTTPTYLLTFLLTDLAANYLSYCQVIRLSPIQFTPPDVTSLGCLVMSCQVVWVQYYSFIRLFNGRPKSMILYIKTS